ncbi:MAG: 50S ribosomal L9 C-terminal domain-containing protein, partial [Coriobacteriales bacterium]|nr:50S ribosomal L9 C-terminal domain-containing protein [Coriobacteriales bacterium]
DLGKAIKTAGKHEVTITIYRDIKAVVEVNVVSEDADLEILDELEAKEAEQAAAAEGEEEAAAESGETEAAAE